MVQRDFLVPGEQELLNEFGIEPTSSEEGFWVHTLDLSINKDKIVLTYDDLGHLITFTGVVMTP